MDGTQRSLASREAVQYHFAFDPIFQLERCWHDIAGEFVQPVSWQVGTTRIREPDISVARQLPKPRHDMACHRRLVTNVTAQDQVPTARVTDDIGCLGVHHDII